MPPLASARTARRFVGLTLAVGLLAFASIALTRESGRIAAIWPVNALVLSAMLRSRPTVWPRQALAGYVGCVAANILIGDALGIALLIGAFNQVEALLCAWCCRRFTGRSLDFGMPRRLAVFVAACIGATSVSGLLTATTLTMAQGADFGAVLLRWITSDALGLLMVTPALFTVAMRERRALVRELFGRRSIIAGSALLISLGLVFAQSDFSLLFLVLPSLVLCAFLLSPAGAAVMLLFTGLIVAVATVQGLGPIDFSRGDIGRNVLVLQLFLATATACTLSLAAVLAGLKRANESVRRADLELRHLMDNSADVVIRVEPGKGITWISPGCRSLGYEPEELLGLRANALVHPDDLPDVEALRAGRFAGLPDPPGYQRRFRIHAADGSWRWVEGNPNVIIGEDGRPAAIVNILRDISRQRDIELRLAESEAKYRLLAERATDILACFDLDARFTYLSPAVETVLGYRPDELLGRLTRSIMHPDDYKRSLALYGERLASGAIDEPIEFTYRAYHKDGREVWLEARPRPIFSPETGEVTGFQDIVRDVTQRKMMEDELARARDEAEAGSRIKSEFLANMSHEIRTPLTAILGFTSFLAARRDLAADAAHQISRIAHAGQTLLAIVNDILDFSKIEAGRMPLNPRPASIRETLAESLALFEPQATAKGLELRLEADGDLPSALIDSNRLRQILLNLIGNAIKFTESGNVVVRASYDRAAARLHMTVQDTGVGMDQDSQDKLFKRFSQVDGSTSRKHEGTGLGLAICRGLVEAMGGEIAVSSRPGEGSAFHFHIDAPLCDSVAAEEPAEATADLTGIKILVADDNAVNREIARAILTATGAEVFEAEDGEAAVAAAGARPYDLILMDIRMPQLDGPDASVRIRSRPGPNRDVPIVAFSADHDLERFGELGTRVFDGHVRKPIDGLELLSIIADLTVPQPAHAVREGVG